MTRVLTLAVLALACIATPALASALPPGADATGLARGLLLLSALAFGAALVLAAIFRRRLLGIVGAALLALMLSAGLCIAAEEVAKIGDASVTLSAEAMVAAIAPTVSSFAFTVLSGLATILIARIGPAWLSTILASRVNFAVQTAVDYGLNAVEGAAKGKVLTIPVGSAVVATALQRLLDSTPAWIVRVAGGPAEMGARIFRSLHLEPDSTAAKVLEPALQGLGKAAR